MYKRDAQPVFAGIVTFMRAPFVEFHEVQPGQVSVAGVPHDTTASFRNGARHGPAAIREASVELAYAFEAATEHEVVGVVDGKHMRLPADRRLVDVGDFNVYPAEVQKTADSLRSGMYELSSRGAFPVVLGGDHYITYPLFEGWARAMAEKGAKRLGYLQFDAHFDLGDANLVWGTHWHGANARRVSELDLVDPRNMAWVGVRGYARAEQFEFACKNQMGVFNIKQVREQGIAEVTRRALETASKGCDAVYLTVDIDVVDCVYAPGTGFSAFGGLTPMDLLDAMQILSDSGAIRAFDIVEVAPQLDPTGITPRLAFNATIDFLGRRVLDYE